MSYTVSDTVSENIPHSDSYKFILPKSIFLKFNQQKAECLAIKRT